MVPRLEESMTESTTKSVADSVVDRVRVERKPGGEMFALAGEVGRLRRALTTAKGWVDAAWEAEAEELCDIAEHTRDRLEEELARAAHRMEIDRRRREMGEADAGGDLAAAAVTLSDALLAAYCVLRDVPDEEFGGEMPERERYALRGALMVAQDAANAGMPARKPV